MEGHTTNLSCWNQLGLLASLHSLGSERNTVQWKRTQTWGVVVWTEAIVKASSRIAFLPCFVLPLYLRRCRRHPNRPKRLKPFALRFGPNHCWYPIAESEVKLSQKLGKGLSIPAPRSLIETGEHMSDDGNSSGDQAQAK